MDDGLIEEIKAAGHWRVIIRPLSEPLALPILEAEKAVIASSVLLRGWDVPHIATRQDETSGRDHGDFVQHWCNWYRHREFWRMYPSGQFAHLSALREDTAEDMEGERDVPQGTFISVLGAIWSITEYFEFAKRLVERETLPHGAEISVSLVNTENRALWVSEFNRMPFLTEYRTSSGTITLNKTIARADADETIISISNDAIVDFFSRFGWAAPPELILQDQKRLYSLKG